MKSLIRIFFILLLPCAVAAGTYLFLEQAFLKPVAPGDSQKVLFEIQSDRSFRDVCKQLEAQGFVQYWWTLDIISRVRKKDTEIKAGEYEISRGMSAKEIMDIFISGKAYQRMVTVREGMSVWEIGPEVEKQSLMSAAEFEGAVTNPELMKLAGLPSDAKSFEGYLFPETYGFTRPTTPRKVLMTMFELGMKKWSGEFQEKADKLRMSRHEILTLASIIEKESGSNISEQPLISSVFHNRLKQGMKLQADPTVIYGIENFDGNLTKNHLETPSPYNTYLNFGLPPGPIANPGETAIRAALFPAESNFLYFVGNGQGGHEFSETLQEHNEAVKQYQLGLPGGQ